MPRFIISGARLRLCFHVPLYVYTIIGFQFKVGLTLHYHLGARFTITGFIFVAYIHRTPHEARSIKSLESKSFWECLRLVEAYGLGKYIDNLFICGHAQEINVTHNNLFVDVVVMHLDVLFPWTLNDLPVVGCWDCRSRPELVCQPICLCPSSIFSAIRLHMQLCCALIFCLSAR